MMVDFAKGTNNACVKRIGDVERWAKEVYPFVNDKYGEQNNYRFYCMP